MPCTMVGGAVSFDRRFRQIDDDLTPMRPLSWPLLRPRTVRIR